MEIFSQELLKDKSTMMIKPWTASKSWLAELEEHFGEMSTLALTRAPHSFLFIVLHLVQAPAVLYSPT